MHIPIRQYSRLLARYLRPRRARLLTLATVLFSSIALELVNPQITRTFIDTAASGRADVLTTLIRAGAAYIAIALVYQVMRTAATYVGDGVAWDATNDLQADLALHVLKLDLTFHHARTPGELIQRVDGDVGQLSTFFSQFALRLLSSAVMLVAVLVLMWREDWRFGAAMTLFALIAAMVLGRIGKLGTARWRANDQAAAEFYGFVGERLSATEDIRTSGAVNYTLWRLNAQFHRWFPLSFNAEIFGNFGWMTTLTCYALADLTVFGVGAWLFRLGAITLGTIYLAWDYVYLVIRPINDLRWVIDDLQKASASIARVQELFDTPSRIQDRATLARSTGVDRPTLALDTPLGVEFDSVTFGYTPSEPVLRDISFDVRPGEVLGVLGHTGSGKTTLARLLLRLYEPQSGSIRLLPSSTPLEALPLATLRQHVGLVTQDVQLFQASVRDNLALFDPSIDDAHICGALEELGLSQWLARLPRGLDTRLGAEGSGLSAGEAQLLAFTRVFLRDPGLVILDEASSRLDPATERLIEGAVKRLLAGRSAIIIAHRLVTVQRTDTILILERGVRVEYGRREALAADPGSRLSRLLKASAGTLVS